MPTRRLPEGLVLASGAHDKDLGVGCIVEWASYLAGEPWSDHPESVCPVIAEFCRSWNDGLDDEGRQMLGPYVARIIGTNRGRVVAERRAWIATDWMVRSYAPAWLRAAGLTDHAHALESLAAVTSIGSARAAQPCLNAARDAAGATAWNSAAPAARDATWRVVAAAGGDAARDAAWNDGGVAGVASGAAARAIAGLIVKAIALAVSTGGAMIPPVGDAAWDAAGAALAPTVKALQASALRLLDRMIEVEEGD